MAIIQLEPGDTCEVEDNVASGWNPQSVDELIVELVEDNSGYWDVVCPTTGRRGMIHEMFLHFKS